MTQIATEAAREAPRRRSARAYILSAIGPVTVAAGVVGALFHFLVVPGLLEDLDEAEED
jgi:hypothetical protein